MQKKNKKTQYGFFLIEAVIATAVVATTLVMMLGASTNVSSIGRYSLQKTQSAYLLEEAAEVIKIIRNQSWTTIANLTNGTTYYMQWGSGTWSYTTTPQQTGIFTRTVVFSAVSRDTGDAIVTSGGTVDSGTRRATITVSWQSNGVTRSETMQLYITSTPSI